MYGKPSTKVLFYLILSGLVLPFSHLQVLFLRLILIRKENFPQEGEFF